MAEFDWWIVPERRVAGDAVARAQLAHDESAVRDVVHRWMTLVDQRQWEGIAALFAARVFVDYTSVRPDPPAGWVEADAMIAGWRRRYDAIVAYQHHVGTFVGAVDGDVARCSGSSIATHQRRAPDGEGTVLWQAGVYHRWQLVRDGERWRLTHIAAHKLWERVDSPRAA